MEICFILAFFSSYGLLQSQYFLGLTILVHSNSTILKSWVFPDIRKSAKLTAAIIKLSSCFPFIKR